MADMDIPPGHHVHHLPLLCAVLGNESASGLLSITIETDVRIVHQDDSEASLSAEPTTYGISDNQLQFRSTVSTMMAHRTQAELLGEDLIVDLRREKVEDDFEHCGILCDEAPEDNKVLLVRDLLPHHPADLWNECHAFHSSWEAQIVSGDEIVEVNGVSGAYERMTAELYGPKDALQLRIKRPTRQARAVLEAADGDLQAARDILLGDAAAAVPLHLNTGPVTCTLCVGDAAPGEAMRIRPCGHGWFCRSCMHRWTGAQVTEGRCTVTCPIPECKKPIGHRQLRAVLTGAGFETLVQRSVEQLCASDDSLIACPTPDCPYRAWLVESQETRLVCELCHVESCVRCAATPYHHGLTCEEGARRAELSMGAVARVRRKVEEVLREALIRKCPGCRAPIERADECCHMTCSTCRAEFSWICGEPWEFCRQAHNCTERGVFLPQILEPLCRPPAARRGEDPSLGDEEASDLFLELRCVHSLSRLREEIGATAWEEARSTCPDILQGVIRGCRDVPWEDIGNARRLRQMQRLLPYAFPLIATRATVA